MNIIEGQKKISAPPSGRMLLAMTLALMMSVVFSTNANSQAPVAAETEKTLVSLDEDELQEQTVELTNEQTVEQMLEPFAASVVQIRNRDRLCCLGTIVADGLVVTKRSELSGIVTCITADGSRIPAALIASDQLDDLALLRLVRHGAEITKLPPALKFDRDASVESGDVLFSVGPDANPVSVGVATVSPRRIPVAQPACRDCVDLGVTVSVQPEREQVVTTRSGNLWPRTEGIAGARVNRVYPRTLGERVGILQGDLLVSINHQWVPNAATLRSIGSRVRVGQTVDIVVVREGALKQLSMKIDHFLRRVYHDRWGGGPFSERRFGFSTTIVHDSLIEPSQCGGPLVDLDGTVVGLNIARSMRVATLAVPSARVREFVTRFSHVQLGSNN